ncbi:MAG: epoxyqueuosine reductase QueH [Sphaerochaetaceae bacterium]|nr:epoxyqueuosine reductase QueH [Sphaerochaetaceae bacterium]
MNNEHSENPAIPILLHCCCGPCSTSSIERLKSLGYEPHLFYANSNIYPVGEWEKRYDSLKEVASYFDIPVSRKEYDHGAWLDDVKGFENEIEGGARCARCFDHNLQQAAQEAAELGFEYFTTTLSVSPHKKSLTIFAIGNTKRGFVPVDFKKKDGFQRSIELSKELNLYRQNYCGCEFSMHHLKKKNS